jgi:hypothetical protein
VKRALAALALAAAACGQPTTGEDCGGDAIAVLGLRGVRDDAGTGCAVPPPEGWTVPQTLPVSSADDPAAAFHAEFRADSGSGAVVYCTRQAHAALLRGTRTGGHLRVTATLSGAVLGACAATCAPLVTEVIEGDLVPGAGGAEPAFTGVLTETFDGGAGPCGACQLPCTSRYVLTGVAE